MNTSSKLFYILGKMTRWIDCIDKGDVTEMRRLLEQGARVNEADRSGLTALHHACYKDRLDIVQVLIDFHADVNATTNNGWTPLHVACRHSKDKSVPEFLHAQGADPLILDNNGNSILHHAAEKGNLIGISFALQFRDVNLRDKDGKTPLYYGVKENASIDALQLLLDAGADPEIRRNNSNKTAIDEAVYKGQDVMDLLRRYSKNAHERKKKWEEKRREEMRDAEKRNFKEKWQKIKKEERRKIIQEEREALERNWKIKQEEERRRWQGAQKEWEENRKKEQEEYEEKKKEGTKRMGRKNFLSRVRVYGFVKVLELNGTRKKKEGTGRI